MMTQQITASTTNFKCGCVWMWWTGQIGPHNNSWYNQCDRHAAQNKPVDKLGRVCNCLNVTKDDGATTCWQHHDCRYDGCSHWE